MGSREVKKALDLFCGSGGAAKGLQRAGYHVTGVDRSPQPFYCGDAMVIADALAPPFSLQEFDLVWASPPCQFFTVMAASNRAQGVKPSSGDLLNPILDWFRAELAGYAKPWIVENVLGAGQHMKGAIQLHGGHFGLQVHRPRLFLSNWPLFAPGRLSPITEPIGVWGERPRPKTKYRTRMSGTGRSPMRIAKTLPEAQQAMGMDWADWHGTKEAIPPAYSEYLGRQILKMGG